MLSKMSQQTSAMRELLSKLQLQTDNVQNSTNRRLMDSVVAHRLNRSNTRMMVVTSEVFVLSAKIRAFLLSCVRLLTKANVLTADCGWDEDNRAGCQRCYRCKLNLDDSNFIEE